MSQYNETVSPDEEAIGIDQKDLFISILLRWKPIMICLLICALLGYGFAYLKADTPVPVQAQLENARAQLSEEQRADVESLYTLYHGYQEYRRSLQDDHARYLSNASRVLDYILLTASYYLTSSLEGLEAVLDQTLLSEEDYNALRSICSEEEDLTSVYHRVKIICSGSNKASGVVTEPESDEGSPLSYFILVTLYGSSEEECAALFDVIDSAIKHTADSLQKMDPGLLLRTAEKKYSHNAGDFVDQSISEHEMILSNVETQMLNLKNNRISALSSAEKKYYDMLSVESENTAPQPAKQISWKKWTVVGAFLGFFFSVGFCILLYLSDGTIKTPEESEWLFQTQTLQLAFLPGKRNLFGKWASKLIGADRIPMKEKAELLAADLQLLTEKAGYHRLFLLCDSEDENACRFASMVKELILQRNSGLELMEGNPFMTVSELEMFSTFEAAVVFTELKHSSYRVQTNWSELCTRYQLPVLGSAAVRICW